MYLSGPDTLEMTSFGEVNHKFAVDCLQNLRDILLHRVISGIMDKEGGYTSKPPLLDDSNYDFWKSRMEAFIKSMDMKAWKAILKGWEHPKPEEDWTTAEDTLAVGNSKALNALFNGVDKNMFRLIKRKFENLKMKEDESVHDFYMNVMDFANSFDDLREKMSDEKIVRKILRSLTKKFDMKVISMEEAQDISTMRVDELIGSLQTYESSVNARIERKNKSIALVSNTAEEDEEDEQDSGESLSEAIVMLGRQFNKVMRKVDKNPWKGAKNNASDIMRNIDAHKRSKGDEKPTVNKGIQCHECEGYGHIRIECGTYLRKQKKSLVASWSDEEESEGEKEFEAAKHVRVLTGIVESDTESCDEELTFKELATTYKELCLVSFDKCREIEKLKKINSQLKADQARNISRIEELQIKVNHLTSDLDEANKEIDLLNVNVGRLRKYSEMLNKTGDEKLDEILEHHKRRPKFTGISYENVTTEEVTGANMSRKVPQHPTQHHGNFYYKKHHPWRCHYCGRKGHIRPFCYKLYGYPQEKQQTEPIPMIKQEWKVKSENITIETKVDEDQTENQVTGLIAHTSFRASSKEDWYFDSGCSRHMTGDDRFLVDIKSYSTSYVTFGDGAKGEIIGVGKLINKSLPKLDNVLLVKGLTANLISISQLCDQGHLNLRSMKKEISEEAIRGLPKLKIAEGIKHEFSSPITPQQNGVMLHAKKLPYFFWAEAMNTACYIHNRVTLRTGTNTTLYELWKNKKPTVKYFHVFGSKCYILADRKQRRKLDPKSDEGIFLGYSTNSRAYRVFNSRTKVMMESRNVVIVDHVERGTQDAGEDAAASDSSTEVFENVKEDENNMEASKTESMSAPPKKGPSIRIQKNHPSDLIIGNPDQGISTRRMNDVISNACFVSKIEQKNVKEALTDDCWINAMQEELEQFKRNEVWELVPRPKNVNMIGTKWVFMNKSDENGVVTRNKARLVAQGYAQIEGIDFDETFAHVARLESIRLLLGVACILKFKLFQMDVKSAFLNGYLNEEVFVEQPKGFIEPTLPNHVYKLKKALYGLKQAPRAWYERLTEFLLSQGYRKRGNDKTLFVKKEKGDFIIAQIYVDDIVFGGMSSKMVQHFVQQMQSEFEMSLVGELTYFLGLQVKQMENTIFVSQSKYAKNIVKKFGMDGGNHKRTPAATHLKLTKDETGIDVDQSLYRSMIGSLLYLTASRPDITFAVGVCARYQAQPKMSHLVQVKRILKSVNGTCDYGILYCHSENSTLVGYCDADWAGSADDRKSTSCACFFLGNNLISWFSKKQNSVSLSTAEAEYIAAGSSCSQLLWMKQMLKEYNVEQDVMTLYCDNLSAINISKNPIQHSRTKHIDIRHHFIRDLVEDKIVTLEHIGTEDQLADIFSKALDAVQFEKLRGKLGIFLLEDL
ncbi:hypothetical protein TSUD_134870 [Trifolium subterraneum]|uniref:Uncharacterized protein n=1 Tax=Trifolium subterraneum TaxID=3900 RepID=A0A2Z6NJJ4_TRISU|nr:hypothetical protein TSUD_134870 [Trifolium subterraneum]